MAYLRKPEDKKRGNSNKQSQPTCRVQKQVSVLMPVSTPPIIPVGEDHASHDRHVKLLKAECKKLHPNKEVTRDLMRTFPIRRENILGQVIPMETILLTYAPLKKYAEVCNSLCSACAYSLFFLSMFNLQLVQELNRIMEREVSREISEKWRMLCPKIVAFVKDELVSNTVVQLLLEDMKEDLDEGKIIAIIVATCHTSRSTSKFPLFLHNMILLYYLLTDVRTRPDHKRIVTCIPVSYSIYMASIYWYPILCMMNVILPMLYNGTYSDVI